MDTELRELNPYVLQFIHLKDVVERADRAGVDLQNVRLNLVPATSREQRRFNLPTSNDIAVAFPMGEDYTPQDSDIVIHRNDGHLIRIPESNPLVDPLTYPILYPSGGEGWKRNMPLRRTVQSTRNRLTLKMHYAHVLRLRGAPAADRECSLRDGMRSSIHV